MCAHASARVRMRVSPYVRPEMLCARGGGGAAHRFEVGRESREHAQGDGGASHSRSVCVVGAWVVCVFTRSFLFACGSWVGHKAYSKWCGSLWCGQFYSSVQPRRDHISAPPTDSTCLTAGVVALSSWRCVSTLRCVFLCVAVALQQRRETENDQKLLIGFSSSTYMV